MRRSAGRAAWLLVPLIVMASFAGGQTIRPRDSAEPSARESVEPKARESVEPKAHESQVVVGRDPSRNADRIRGRLVAVAPAVAPVPKITSGWGTGVAWPNPRFTDNRNGTVTDHLTGLIWLRNADCFGAQTWEDARAKAEALFDGCENCGGEKRDCGLGDGTRAGNWRLPNVRELNSLVDYGGWDPDAAGSVVPDTEGAGKWSEGDPFTAVQLADYWSSTKWSNWITGPETSWAVSMGSGAVALKNDYDELRVWLVRGGS